MENSLNAAKSGKPTTVSVIVIFYNAEKFMEEAVQSVLGQTYSHWELILVDDGSSDASTAIAKKFVNLHPQKISYVEHPGHKNRGTAAARNLGIRHANGKYIALLDADDVWLPDKLSDQMKIMKEHPSAGMVCGAVLHWRSWDPDRTDQREDNVRPIGAPQNSLITPPTLYQYLYPLNKGVTPLQSDIMFKKEVWQKIGGFEERFKGQYQLYEDQCFLNKVYLSFQVYVSDQTWTKYRRHPNQCVAVVRGAGQYDLVRKHYLKWFKRYLFLHGQFGTEVWHLTQKALLPYKKPLWLQLKHSFKMALAGFNGKVNNAGQPLPAPGSKQSSDTLPAIGKVQLGDLRRTTPLSRDFGFDRGGAIDRVFIERFLAGHKQDIKGKVLEVKDNVYTRMFGEGQVSQAEILDINPNNSKATIIADLSNAPHIPSNAFDCVILTQVLQFIYDAKAAINTIHRILKPGGVLLLTVPGITQIAYTQLGDVWFWSFSEASIKKMVTEIFRDGIVTIQKHGNVLAAAGFLYGLGSQELKREELDFNDPDYQVIITARAVKGKVDHDIL